MAAPLCQICGKRAATYVCQDCGKTVCSNCFDPAHWSCTDCQAKLRPSAVAEYPVASGFSLATWLFFIAFAIIFIGMLLMTYGSLSKVGDMTGGAIILIGPIPIILGTGPYSFTMVALAVVLMVAALVFYLVLRKRLR